MALSRTMYFLLWIVYGLTIHLGMIIYATGVAPQLRRRRLDIGATPLKLLTAAYGWGVAWLLLSWDIPSGGGEGNIEGFLFPFINYPALFFSMLAQSVSPASWGIWEYYFVCGLFGAAGGWGLGQGIERWSAKFVLDRPRH